MLRQTVRSLGALSVTDNPSPVPRVSRFSSFHSLLEADAKQAEISVVRKWLADLNPDTIPGSALSFTSSKSSGPGGQKVHSTQSKAHLRMPMKTLERYIPQNQMLHEAFREHRYCTKKSDDILIASDKERSLQDNKQSCLKNLHIMLRDVGQEFVRNGSDSQEDWRAARIAIQKKKNIVEVRTMKDQQRNKAFQRERNERHGAKMRQRSAKKKARKSQIFGKHSYD